MPESASSSTGRYSVFAIAREAMKLHTGWKRAWASPEPKKKYQVVTVGAGGVSLIWVLDDQDEFEKTYPEARFERSGTPYPVRMLQVAAARRVHALDAAGQPARIAVDD